MTSFILSGSIFACKIVILRNFDAQNHNAEIGLKNGLIPQKPEWLASLETLINPAIKLFAWKSVFSGFSLLKDKIPH